ncbi:hypothetical protein [Paraflavitalea devenefica]|uniref:hypothetical protein n=1 Tax=Paraflavitalea devenefica TaxID=2716334 RepID=UPI001ABA085C|nr:hypothetical protein [Paraflavitalea devenefica]
MENTTATYSTSEAIHAFVAQLGTETILDTAIGCRVSGILPVPCAPILLATFPGTTVTVMANTVTTAWAGMIDVPTLTQALTDCNYLSTDITTAVQQAISLTYLQNALYNDSQSVNKAIALYQGDLTKMKTAETVDYLVISALPNDYTPTPGSMIAALNSIGVSVATLAQNKAADYRPTSYCWVSQPISNQAFKRIICFEATQQGNGAASQVPGIFTSLQQFAGTAAQNIVVATSMVCTGSAGATPANILTALFNGCKATITTTFSLMCFKIVNFNASWTASLNQLFTQLKQG